VGRYATRYSAKGTTCFADAYFHLRYSAKGNNSVTQLKGPITQLKGPKGQLKGPKGNSKGTKGKWKKGRGDMQAAKQLLMGTIPLRG